MLERMVPKIGINENTIATIPNVNANGTPIINKPINVKTPLTKHISNCPRTTPFKPVSKLLSRSLNRF